MIPVHADQSSHHWHKHQSLPSLPPNKSYLSFHMLSPSLSHSFIRLLPLCYKKGHPAATTATFSHTTTGNLGNLANGSVAACCELWACTINYPWYSKWQAKMSINPEKTNPYSEDLQWRMICQREALSLDLKTATSNLEIDPSTVSWVVSLFRSTGSVQKWPYPDQTKSSLKLYC